MTEKQHLPREETDTVVDISLRHIIIAFGSLVVASFSIGVGIVFVRDYTKLRRQKAIIDAATELLLTLQQNERRDQWRNEKKKTDMPSISPTTK